MSRALTILLLSLGLTLGAAGCGEDLGYLEGSYLALTDCGEEEPRVFAPFRLSFSLFGVERGAGPLYIRAQRQGHEATDADVFLIAVEDEAALREALRERPEAALPFGGPGAAAPGEGAPIRGSLVLGRRCPNNRQPLELRGGTILFESLGREPGDTIRLHMSGLSVVDTRRDEVVGEDFQGEMDFEIRGGPPYRPFTE